MASKRYRERVLDRDGHRCAECGKSYEKKELHVHHLIPRKLGGSDELGNLVSLCV